MGDWNVGGPRTTLQADIRLGVESARPGRSFRSNTEASCALRATNRVLVAEAQWTYSEQFDSAPC